jgi:hypothetical protein
MKQHLMKMMWMPAFFCAMIVMTSGCGTSKRWYKPDHSQVDFDLDHRECMIMAEEISRQATITGEKQDQDVLSVTYSNCLFSRGWTHTPPGELQKHVQPTPLATIDGNRIHVFDEILLLPDDFHLVSNQTGGFQDVMVQTLLIALEDRYFLNIVIQEILSRQFDSIDYPVNDPFFVFDKGNNIIKGENRVDWKVFAGEFQGQWMAGIGAYYLKDKHRRITLVLTTDIPAPTQDPPAGLLLAKSQQQAVVSFSNQWLEYITSAMRTQAVKEKPDS